MLAAPHFLDEGPQQQATIAPSAVLTESPSRRHTQFSEFPMDSDPWAHRPLPPDSSGPAISGAVEGSRWIAQYAPPVPSSSSTMLPHPDPAFEPIAPPPASGSTAPLNLSPLATVSHLPVPRRASLTSPENITVGDYLTSFPKHPAPNPSPTRTLGSPSRRNADGGFEAESVVDGPIGLTPRVKPFIAKLAHLLARPESYQDCIVWDADGEAFILNASKRLTGEVFPRLFGHSTLASFTRQLNVYGFRRLTNSELASRIDVADQSGYSGWEHELFKRGDKSTLHLLNPRPSRARQIKKAQKQDKADRETEARERKARATATAAVESMTRGDGPRIDLAAPWWGSTVPSYDIAPFPRRDSHETVSSNASHNSAAYDSASSATTASTGSPHTLEDYAPVSTMQPAPGQHTLCGPASAHQMPPWASPLHT